MRKKFIISTTTGLTSLFVAASTVFATQTTPGNVRVTIAPIGNVIENPSKAITFFVQLALTLAGLLAFFFLILGGIKWITSGGDKGKIEEARNQIIHALVGVIVVFAAWALTALLGTLLGVNFFNINIPSPAGP